MKPPRSSADRTPGPCPGRVVALGGGTGLPAVLRGFRNLVSCGRVRRLAAIVAMSDDGGSSGRLRRSRGVPPPGDVRNCLVALSEDEDLLTALFQHRYGGDEVDLGGHNLGNLILAALAEQTGSFLKAVKASSHVLRTVGDILPVTLEDVVLEASAGNGTRLVGETAIGNCLETIERVALRPRTAKPTPGVVEAIRKADLIAMGPGSLFTSVLPTFLLDDVANALKSTRAVRVLVANLVSEIREASDLDLEGHLGVIESHAGGRVVDAVLVHQGPIAPATLARYEAEGAAPLGIDENIEGLTIVRRNLLGPGPKLRHDPAATAAGLLAAWRAVSRADPPECSDGP